MHQATTDPGLSRRLLDIHGKVWVSLLWGQCSFLLGPGAHKVCAHQDFVPQSCVSSDGSVVGLMATSSRRAYATRRSAAPRAAAPAAGHCWPRPPQEALRHIVSQSLWGLWVLVCTRFVWALWEFLAGMGFDSNGYVAPPTILLGLLLCFCGVSSHSHSSATLSPLQHLPCEELAYILHLDTQIHQLTCCHISFSFLSLFLSVPFSLLCLFIYMYAYMHIYFMNHLRVRS